ncbi:hypothetical protein HPB47_000572 [Ixodes persulcatus]|uniref:Uncharacterized protein n=1 Tax=Ixodes persulcatus TaxID=34615 RepID=A0AC60PSW1_IXOPE|nr:hypothetical protein HPB47_000572 [Ixodes persulcatus]
MGHIIQDWWSVDCSLKIRIKQQLRILAALFTIGWCIYRSLKMRIKQQGRDLATKSRTGKEKHGEWYEPDPHTRCKVSPENLSAALEYFTKDELQCSAKVPTRRT